MNGFELLGRPLKVNHVTEREGPVGAMEVLDSDEFDSAGIGMTKQSRAQLMAKLAEGHNAGKIHGYCISCMMTLLLVYKAFQLETVFFCKVYC